MIVIITRWLIITVAILLASQFVPGIKVDTLSTAIIAACVLGLINIFIRPDFGSSDSAFEHIDAGNILFFYQRFYAGTRRLFCVGFCSSRLFLRIFRVVDYQPCQLAGQFFYCHS